MTTLPAAIAAPGCCSTSTSTPLSSSETSSPNALNELNMQPLPTHSIGGYQQQPPTGAGAGGGGGGGGAADPGATASFMHHFQQNMQTLLRPSLVDLACSYFGRPQPIYPQHMYPPALGAAGAHHMVEAAAAATALQLHEQLPLPLPLPLPLSLPLSLPLPVQPVQPVESPSSRPAPPHIIAYPISVLDTSKSRPSSPSSQSLELHTQQQQQQQPQPQPHDDVNATRTPPKKKGFSISALLGGST